MASPVTLHTEERPKRTPRWLSSPVTLHAVQCARCLKWRVIPEKELYEAIREHILEQPWTCENAVNWRPESHCDLPADIEQDQSMLWAIDKPNLPSSPSGWERQITVRTDGSSKFADVYYTSPHGARLRSKNEIEKYISKYPDSVSPETTMDKFSFAIPRPLPGMCPQLTQGGRKLITSNSHVVQEEHCGLQLARQSSDNSPTNEVSSSLQSSHITQPYPVPWDPRQLIFGNSNTQQAQQGISISPQTPEDGSFSNKRQTPDLITPSCKRTKQQVKRDRQNKDSPGFLEVNEEPQVLSTTDGTSDHEGPVMAQ